VDPRVKSGPCGLAYFSTQIYYHLRSRLAEQGGLLRYKPACGWLQTSCFVLTANLDRSYSIVPIDLDQPQCDP
jgi:hypothetical protein